jgi:cation:H+ antiporter
MVSKQPGGLADSLEISKYSTGSAFLWILVGLAGLVLGGKLIVDNAVDIAVEFGLSQRLIGLTIVSVGTSLPELATSIAAVRRKKVDIAIGNVVGSNIFNIFLVMGISSMVNPIVISEANFIDIYMNILAGLLLFLFLFTGKGRKLERWEGVILLGLYVAYLTALIMEW